VVDLAVLHLSTACCILHLGVNCDDNNSSRIGSITHNSNNNNSSSNSRNNNSSSNSSSTMLLLYHRSKLPLGHHSSFRPATFHASTTGRLGTWLMNAASPSKATNHEQRDPWSINKGANRGVLHHGLAVRTTPPWMRFTWEKKC
jgi:hypothetical protein